jgi:outer membrane protein assembly factor BamD (BamD/ComL family)
MARKLYLNADFYRRTGKPVAAAALCRRLLAVYPHVPEAEDARKLLARVDPENATAQQQASVEEPRE